jgi:superfamily II DNA or RNA helicase
LGNHVRQVFNINGRKTMKEYDGKPISLNSTEIELKNPEPMGHQLGAFEKLSGTFKFPQKDYRGAILALPTGAGKTFTAVYWICKNILSKNFKVIWFAHSSYLLDQAYNEFYENTMILHQEQPQREYLNVRVVSSSPNHSKASSINLMDDVLIITTQTGISNFNTEALDLKGKKYETKFLDFLKYNSKKGIFVVLDEAHHAPAYGFRHLWIGIKKLVPNLYILGLTATPAHNDPKISGWLFKIFDPKMSINLSNEEMNKLTEKLILQNFLAKPKFIEKKTNEVMLVDESLRSRLMEKHLPLPKKIVEDLAEKSQETGKSSTIIFSIEKHMGRLLFLRIHGISVYI